MDAPTESGGSGKDKGDCGPAPSSSRTASPPVDDDSYLPQAQGAHEYRDRRDQTPTPRRSPFLPDEAGATESQHEPSSDIVRERSEQSAQSPQHIPYDLNPWQKDAETSSQRTLKAASEPGDAASPAYGSPGPSASAAEEADESRAAADEVDAVADADAGAETEAGPSAQDDPDVQDSDDDSHQTTLSSGSSTIPNTLVVDPDTDPDSDGDSALGATPLISTTSLASTLLRSVEEYGRTYHKYKQGRYLMPNDEQEQQRLELQHYIYKVALGGRLHLAPVENPNRVIDIGTGTGVWAVEFADSNPQSDVLGTDLSPMQSSYTAPNCRFEIDDIEDDWIFNHKFDYIHGRSISTHMRNVPRLCAAMLNNLNPGGWAELQDVIAEFKTFDRTIEGTALQQWNRLMVEGVRNLGRDMRAARSNKRRMEEAGFQNIVEHRLPIPVNHWPRGAQHKNLGRDQMRSALDGIQAPTIQVLSKGLGWSREEAEVFLINVRKEIQNPHIHSYFEMIVVFGQKLPR